MVGQSGGHPRIVRYADLEPCYDAFIDTRTPGSDRKENFTIVGPGVSENPNQYVHITEPHGFNIGGARQPPGCVNSQHSHETVEVFFVHTGTWSFNLGEDGDDAQIVLNPGDFISIPTHVFRGFENVGENTGFLWAVLGNDNPGRVLWAPNVFDMAKQYGLVLLENGNLIDTSKGERVPVGIEAMPVTTKAQVDALKTFSHQELRDCCVLKDDKVPVESAGGIQRRSLIGAQTKLDWEHGFIAEDIHCSGGASFTPANHSQAEVVFIHRGTLTVMVDGEAWVLESGDTASIPKGAARTFHNKARNALQFIRVEGVHS
ncbi:MAG: cupin domain-containing protein [Pseudomonadota bacterium]